MQTSFPDPLPASEDNCSAQRLQRTIRASALAHTFAGVRLLRKERAWQATLVLLALGLILLPLLQNAGVALPLVPSLLNLIQVFLAVAVLTGIVLLAAANFALRARMQSECAERLTELAHEFDKVCEDLGPSAMPSHILDEFRIRHSDALRNIEAPAHDDQRQSRRAMARDYQLDPVSRLGLAVESAASQLLSLALPLLLLIVEGLLLANALGASHSLSALAGPASSPPAMATEQDLTLGR